MITPPPAPSRPLPAWQRDVEGWAVDRERQAHVQALYQYGELTFFALLWHIQDFQAGLVPRCYRCWQGAGDVPALTAPEQQIAAAYGQGNQYACPVCYNTTFAMMEGTSPVPGLRALIVRPALYTEFDKGQTRQAKGVFVTAGNHIETTPDFRVRNGDYALRSDGSRFELRAPERTTLRTGFATPWQATAAITYNLLRANLADPLTPAYLIPPAAPLLAQILGTYTRIPADYSWTEVLNGPLIPEETPPPAASGAAQGPVTFPLSGALATGPAASGGTVTIDGGGSAPGSAPAVLDGGGS